MKTDENLQIHKKNQYDLNCKGRELSPVDNINPVLSDNQSVMIHRYTNESDLNYMNMITNAGILLNTWRAKPHQKPRFTL